MQINTIQYNTINLAGKNSKKKKQPHTQRKYIIRCCGRKSCQVAKNLNKTELANRRRSSAKGSATTTASSVEGEEEEAVAEISTNAAAPEETSSGGERTQGGEITSPDPLPPTGSYNINIIFTDYTEIGGAMQLAVYASCAGCSVLLNTRSCRSRGCGKF